MCTIQEWFDSKVWADGLGLSLDPSVDVDEFYKQYHASPERWKAVFAFMKKDLSSLEVGKYPIIEGELTAIVSEYNTKEPEDARWEAHRRFIDLQYLISGEEQMGVMPLADAKNAGAYNAEKDLIFYGDNDGPLYRATSANYFLFFPGDLHRPGVKSGEAAPVKKLVLKIAVAE
ncbi:YhcH/YjgK/YiaL family protein [Mangrovibacterium marinum]|uniref:YhcH/YjgK/YiaL family protein n=1 Tax=Mangrovibacterium marinum TaxID=1639118 RepID=A0A2T5BYQ8_9BACT|nr:YhcH/YjgK/YiaL family protein [Mangrovibacterium marinum]PTN07376.1 YhcH/YjgK/YiaL family protein [Mangrovibacterium marinum]